MKTVKSLADVARAAAEIGARAEVDGRVINAGAERAAVPRRSLLTDTPPAAGAPTPPQAPTPDPLAKLTEILGRSSEETARALQELATRLAVPPAPPAGPAPEGVTAPPPTRPVAFDIEYDEDSGRPRRVIPVY